MKSAAIAGVILGLMIVGWTFTMGFTGWYKHPTLNFVFGFVALYQLIVLVVLLIRTRKEHGYGGQVLNGLAASVIAAIFAFGGSIVFTTVVFPTYFEDLREMARELGAEEAPAIMQTPLMNAIAGAGGTIVTGLIISAIAAIFLRKRS